MALESEESESNYKPTCSFIQDFSLILTNIFVICFTSCAVAGKSNLFGIKSVSFPI